MTLAAPTYWVVGLLVASLAGTRFGVRTALLSPAALAGCLMYFVSSGFMNVWRLGNDIGEMIAWWQGGLLIVAFLYAYLAATVFKGAKHALPASLACIAYTMAVLAPNVAVEKYSEAALATCIAWLTWNMFRALKPNDLTGLLFVALVAVAESGAVLEYLDCQIFHGLNVPRSEGSACGQIYGWWGPFIQPAITLPFMVYLLFRWYKARPD